MARRGSTTGKRKVYLPGLALFVAFVWLGISAWLIFGEDGLQESQFFRVAIAVIGGLLLLLCTKTYIVDDEGISVLTLAGGRKRWLWKDLGGLASQTLDTEDAINPLLVDSNFGAVYGATGSLVRLRVVDRNNRVVFKVSPWTTSRRDLARQIRQRTRASREQ